MKPEQQILNSILDYLAMRKIWHRRMNTGAVISEYNGKKRMIRYGSVGMADVLAVTDSDCSEYPFSHKLVWWLEVKTPTGKQSDAQREFEIEVGTQGHKYFVVRSIEDVETALNSLEAR